MYHRSSCSRGEVDIIRIVVLTKGEICETRYATGRLSHVSIDIFHLLAKLLVRRILGQASGVAWGIEQRIRD